MSSVSEKLTFVLTIASSNTGRDDQDFLRARLLLDSFERFFELDHLDRFIVVSPEKDRDLALNLVSESRYQINFLLLDETDVCPELSDNPDTTDMWPKRNQGWYRQQLIKLAVHTHVRTRFYMTLDSDVVFVRDFDTHTLVRNDKAALNIQTEGDYRNLYRTEIASREVRVREQRYDLAERVLEISRKRRYSGQWHGETPVLMNCRLVFTLVQHLEDISGQSWRRFLLDKLPWTEYALYFLFAEECGMLHKLYLPGNSDSVSRLSQSLWLPSCDYRQPRNLSTWNPDLIFNTGHEGVAVVIQSYLGYPVAQLDDKVRPHFER